MSKIKMSLPIKAFVLLIALNLIMTGIVVLMADDYETKHAVAMFGLSIFSFIFVGFLIVVKDIVLGEHWSKFSPVIKVIWYFLFIGNSLNFINQFMTTFIFN
ncbi:hypothetical protein H7U05_30920 [Priestia megaterium]|uniref:hypothetical protein n=1 Tax=Priestia megaterium TaxID=1404 RepID=UPI001C8D25C1|nr:hypothetical protein [Priestia megaterium]MBY0201612.1 hypothetical protein [Priestia megaterium]